MLSTDDAAGGIVPVPAPVTSARPAPLGQAPQGQADRELVKVVGVGKTFQRGGRRTTALAGVDLTVARGEFACLLGPSGCGKSTLLNILAGILAYEEGVAEVNGHRVKGPSAERGMMFQSPMLFPWLTTYTLFHVQIRAAVPGIITGMRLSMGGAWTSIVAVEMIAATSGVGFLILQAGNYLLTSLVMSGIIAIGIVGLIFDACLRGLLRLADPSRAVAE